MNAPKDWLFAFSRMEQATERRYLAALTVASVDTVRKAMAACVLT